jgi:hypothetical protein
MQEPSVRSDADAGGDEDFIPAVRAVLGQLGSANAQALAEIVSLRRDHPLSAVWPAVLGRGWVAGRPAGSRPPGPEGPLVWVFGETSADLAARMCVADSALTPPQLRLLMWQPAVGSSRAWRVRGQKRTS